MILAAGDSARFSARGIKKPKGTLQLKWRGETASMIEHCTPKIDDVTVVCKIGDPAFDFLKEKGFYLEKIQRSTGQADSCMQALKYMRGEVLVVNCDNAFDCDISQLVHACRANGASVGAAVFETNGTPEARQKYGYIDAYPFFRFGVEKTPMSPYALAGAFYFRSPAHYYGAYIEALKEPHAELYISALFKHFTAPRFAMLIPRGCLHEWGTPQDLYNDPFVDVVDEEWPFQRREL